MLRELMAAAAVLGLAACSTVPMNQPLATIPAPGPLDVSLTTGGYRLEGLDPHGASPELLVALAFSGGGKRSAAFAYGALQGLRDFPIAVGGVDRRLLDEVDMIASVSGGSFPAAYYGLYHDRIFTDFEADFLRRDIESYIYGIYLLPWNWEWWLNPLYGTNDEMAQIYDELMFHGATYADLIANGLPLVSINATDINFGVSFSFTQNQFDLICSDLASFPVARAVAASNGFPVLFTPITLTNHASECGGQRPSWMDQADTSDPLARERVLVATSERYLDAEDTRYIHLMDGGISDNLAMRGMVNQLVLFGGNKAMLRAHALSVRRLLLVSVDGQASADSSWPQQRTIGALTQILSAVTGAQIDRYNYETLILAREQLERVAENLRVARCEQAPVIDGYPCDDVQAYFLHVALTDIADPAIGDRLRLIPAGLTIPDADVDLLIEQGRMLIQSSDELGGFRDRIEAPAVDTPGQS